MPEEDDIDDYLPESKHYPHDGVRTGVGTIGGRLRGCWLATLWPGKQGGSVGQSGD